MRRGLIGTTVVTHAPGGGDRFAMLVVSPPVVSSDMVLARDLTLVVDVSGSMSGGKMEQARSALNQALGTLRAADRFRVIAFSSGVTEFASGYTVGHAARMCAGRANSWTISRPGAGPILPAR